jgi:hypothetical protein
VHRRVRGIGSASLIVAVGIAWAGPASTQAGGPVSWKDYDGDGFDDLAIGMSGRDVNGRTSAGAVLVLYGSKKGLTAAGSQLWHQDSPGVKDTAEANDNFGTAVASGDFNGDGFADLAVGAPDEGHHGFPQAGQVHILFGSPNGLTGAGSRILRNTTHVGDADMAKERFGAAVVALDRYDPEGISSLEEGSDGIADLAVGIPSDGSEAGAYRLYPADVGGFNGALAQSGCQDVDAVGRCGLVLAAGRLDDDTIDDLVIGAPDAQEGGMVVIDRTGDGGSRVSFSQNDLPVANAAPGSQFGAALAIGDTGGTSAYPELLVGAPAESVPLVPGPGNAVGAGRVYVLNGTSSGPTDAIVGVVDATTDDAPGGANAFDAYGASLAIVNLGRGPELDVAIGSAGDDAGGQDRAGAVVILYGDDTAQRWHQGVSGVDGIVQANDRFGSVLTFGRYGKGGTADLAIGIPREQVGGEQVGGVEVLYGAAGGPTSANDQLWHLDVSGVPGVADEFDRFGSALR